MWCADSSRHEQGGGYTPMDTEVRVSTKTIAGVRVSTEHHLRL